MEGEVMGSESKEFRRVIQLPYWRRAEADLILEAWQDSGETLAAFARRWSVNVGRLARWVAEMDEEERPSLGFHRVELVNANSARVTVDATPRLLAELACGAWTVRVPIGFDPEEMGCLLRLVCEEVAAC